MTSIKKEFIVPNSYSGKRADIVAQDLMPDYSRVRIQRSMKDGLILCDSKKISPKDKLIGGELLCIEIEPQKSENQFNPEEILLDVIYEDDDILVINKPVGLVVHPGAGNWEGTLLNGIIYRYPENKLLARGGIVHRLDKNTSGLMVVAKNEITQLNLVNQLQSKKVYREYRAIVWGQVAGPKIIDEPIGRHPTVRTKMAINHINGKKSVTHYEILEKFGMYSYLKCRLETGRTHQIRVHMMHNFSPIVGDPTYGLKKIISTKDLSKKIRDLTIGFPRQALHASSLGLIHPKTKKDMKWEVELPQDMKELLDIIRFESPLIEDNVKINKYDFYIGDDGYMQESIDTDE
tara:strand:- start:2393 stop:3436 length:1044 start_codon:yes stop_codon:yes gene_type:complete